MMQQRGTFVPVALAIGVFASLSLSAGITSEGFLEADGCTHYLYARFAIQEPHFLTNVWGRPLFAGLYAIPASYGGLHGTHLMSLVLAVACGWVAMLIGRGQNGRWPVLALIFTLGQPLVFLHSFSELTELPFATLLGFAFLAYQRKRWLPMAILLGLGPLGRPEGFGFLILGAIALAVERRWWWLFVLPIPLLIWNHAGWTMAGRAGPWWSWLPANWPYAAESLYEPGNPLHYAALLPAVSGPFIFPATCLGIWRSFRDRLEVDPHLHRCQWLIAAIPLLVLAGHSALYATGKLASSGELRYMLVVAPFWGLLAARGWEWAFTRMNWRRPLRWAGAAALAGAVANAIYPVIPLRPSADEDYMRAQRFVEWYRRSGLERQFPRLCTAQPCIFYFLDVSPTDRDRAMEYHRARVSSPPPKTILVWDPIYSLYNADAQRSIPIDELLGYGWRLAPDGLNIPIDKWQILFSESLSTTQESPHSRPSP